MTGVGSETAADTLGFTGAGPGLIAQLAVLSGLIAGRGPAGDPVVLSDRDGELVVRVGDVVFKAHAADSDPVALAARLRAAVDPRLNGVLLAPIPIPGATVGGTGTRIDGRLVTAWPAGTPLRLPEIDSLAWERVAGLLARLHATSPADELPASEASARVARAVRRLRGAIKARFDPPAGPGAGRDHAVEASAATVTRTLAAADAVIRGYASLPGWARGEAPAPSGGPRLLVHGDWHFGQLVGVEDGWRLIDIDTLGVGDPSWDLARPAAWYAAGLVSPSTWQRFLGAYQEAGGTAVAAGADPWSTLDIPARALAVQSAAAAVAEAVREGGDLDDTAEAFVGCCVRIARIDSRPGLGLFGTLLGTSRLPT